VELICDFSSSENNFSDIVFALLEDSTNYEILSITYENFGKKHSYSLRQISFLGDDVIKMIFSNTPFLIIDKDEDTPEHTSILVHQQAGEHESTKKSSKLAYVFVIISFSCILLCLFSLILNAIVTNFIKFRSGRTQSKYITDFKDEQKNRADQTMKQQNQDLYRNVATYFDEPECVV
jgi:hypothetical protein